MKTFDNINNLEQLSQVLKVPKRKLTYILYVKRIENLYIDFEIPKKTGGTRKISSPSNDLKEIQKNIAKLLEKQQEIFLKENNIKSNISHAFTKDKSIMTNALIHKHKKYVLNIDLEDFFDSFHFGRVAGYFEKNENFLFPKKTAVILAQLTCYNGKLPQGAPSSPIITNLICNILDMKLLKISKKFKVDYSRYADDLTFSTNNNNFIEELDTFLSQLEQIINKSGFEVNKKKTRIQYRESKQMVTGLVVNKKVNINRKFYRETRAMAISQYLTGAFKIDNEEGNLKRLEGRFAFINQIDRFNKKRNSKNTVVGKKNGILNGKEKQYQMFLFYKYFYCNSKPCIVTEGKTDIMYIKAALKNLYKFYPKLIEKKSDGTFHYNISFLKRSKRIRYFFGLNLDGADTMNKIYNYYCDVNNANFPNYAKFFENKGVLYTNPTILIYDNEMSNNKKPLYKALNVTKINENKEKSEFLSRNHYTNITSNLYILTHQLVNGLAECEIEDLFDSKILEMKINGKSFERELKDFNDTEHYGKAVFANYILKNYHTVNFDNFRPFLDCLNQIVEASR